jgi:hypothetical protein
MIFVDIFDAGQKAVIPIEFSYMGNSFLNELRGILQLQLCDPINDFCGVPSNGNKSDKNCRAP